MELAGDGLEQLRRVRLAVRDEPDDGTLGCSRGAGATAAGGGVGSSGRWTRIRVIASPRGQGAAVEAAVGQWLARQADAARCPRAWIVGAQVGA